MMPDTKLEELAKIFNCNCEHCYGRQHNIAMVVAVMILEARIQEQSMYVELDNRFKRLNDLTAEKSRLEKSNDQTPN